MPIYKHKRWFVLDNRVAQSQYFSALAGLGVAESRRTPGLDGSQSGQIDQPLVTVAPYGIP